MTTYVATAVRPYSAGWGGRPLPEGQQGLPPSLLHLGCFPPLFSLLGFPTGMRPAGHPGPGSLTLVFHQNGPGPTLQHLWGPRWLPASGVQQPRGRPQLPQMPWGACSWVPGPHPVSLPPGGHASFSRPPLSSAVSLFFFPAAPSPREFSFV